MDTHITLTVTDADNQHKATLFLRRQIDHQISVGDMLIVASNEVIVRVASVAFSLNYPIWFIEMDVLKTGNKRDTKETLAELIDSGWQHNKGYRMTLPTVPAVLP